MYDRIVVPLDGSEIAEAVLPYVTELSQRLQSHLLLLRVVPPIPTRIAAEGLFLDEIYAQERADAEAYIKTMLERFERNGLPVEGAVIDGPPADEIIDYATQQHADLIAMSTHGRGGIGRWVYGSVADRVLRGASCPVLLVRATGTTS